MAGEARRPRSPPPRGPRPRPDLQLSRRAGVASFPPRRPIGVGVGAAGLAMRPPTRRGIHPCRFSYAHITWRGTRGWGRRTVAVMGCGRAVFSVSTSRSSSRFTRHTATPAHYQTVAPRVGRNIWGQRSRYPLKCMQCPLQPRCQHINHRCVTTATSDTHYHL